MKRALVLIALALPALAQFSPPAGGGGGAPTGPAGGALAGTYPNPGLATGFTYLATAYGMLCDNATDDTAAFNTLLATVNTAGGGTIYIPGICRLSSGNIVFPNDGLTQPSQSSIRITGNGMTANGQWTALPSAKSALDLRFNATVAKLDTRGKGYLEIDNLALIDGGSDCAPFIQTTNTTLHIHDVVFSGTVSGSACNDAVVLGSTTTTIGGAATAPFQGYGTVIRDNFFDRIRRGVFGRTYANGVQVADNTWSATAGSNLTTAITAATNANPAVLTVTGHGFMVGTSYTINVSGGAGSWAGINGAHVVTPISANTFSMPVDSSGFGALAGSPAFLSGAALEFSGTSMGSTDAGDYIYGNLIELSNYPYAMKFDSSVDMQVMNNNLYDDSSLTLAYYRLQNNSKYSTIFFGFTSDGSSPFSEDATSLGGNTYLTSHQQQMSVWPQPWKFTNSNVVFANSSNQGPIIQETSGKQWFDTLTSTGQELNFYSNSSGSNLRAMTLWNISAGSDRLTLQGNSSNRLESASAAELEIYAGTGHTLWLGDASKYISMTNGNVDFDTSNTRDIGATHPPRDLFVGRTNSAALYATATNCSSSAAPAVCGAAPAGSAVIAAAATTVVVNTTAVTANSQITVTEDSSLGTKLSVTCNTQALTAIGAPRVTARTATSFTVAVDVAPAANPLCFGYSIVN